jgi:hypothetical protein
VLNHINTDTKTVRPQVNNTYEVGDFNTRYDKVFAQSVRTDNLTDHTYVSKVNMTPAAIDLQSAAVLVNGTDLNTLITNGSADTSTKTQNIQLATTVAGTTDITGDVVVSNKTVVPLIESIGGGGGGPLLSDDFTGVTLNGNALLSGNQIGYPLHNSGSGTVQLLTELNPPSLDWGAISYDTNDIGSLTNSFIVQFNGRFSDVNPPTDATGFSVTYGSTRSGTIGN